MRRRVAIERDKLQAKIHEWQNTELELQAERDELKAKAPREPFDVRCADALADEVGALVKRGIIDARSPAADALLDYRNPPNTPRADRLASLEVERDSQATLAAGYKRERDAAQAEIDRLTKFMNRNIDGWQEAMQEDWSEPVARADFTPVDVGGLVSRTREETREACAKLALSFVSDFVGTDNGKSNDVAEDIAAAIRGGK